VFIRVFQHTGYQLLAHKFKVNFTFGNVKTYSKKGSNERRVIKTAPGP
jgi:hypothetical protein